MPPPSAGGILLLQILKILEKLDYNPKGSHSAAARDHLVVEAMRRAFVTRYREPWRLRF